MKFSLILVSIVFVLSLFSAGMSAQGIHSFGHKFKTGAQKMGAGAKKAAAHLLHRGHHGHVGHHGQQQHQQQHGGHHGHRG